MINKVLLIFLVIGLSLTTFSCKKTIKEAPKAKYSIESKTTTITWTAYKTTAKIPVTGTFKEINVSNSYTSDNPNDVINGLEFSIPVNSIDTKKPERDTKIVASFFGAMKDTNTLTGKISLDGNGKGHIDLKMNGVTFKLPMTYIISGQLAEIDAVMDLDNWQAQLAITALNKACENLHKGEDGISKTWNEVGLHIVSYLKVE